MKVFGFSFIFLSFFVLSTSAQNGLDFDGSNDYVQTGFSGVLGKTNRTFEAWVKIDSNASGNDCVLDYGANAVGSRNTFSVNRTNGTLVFISGGTNANISSASSNVVPIGIWAHVAFVLKNDTGYLYVNSKQVGTGLLSTVNTPSGKTDVRIGQRVAGGSIPFKGSIDEVRMWNYARSPKQLSDNYQLEFCDQQAGLVLYHKFNHGIVGGNNSKATTSTDYSKNQEDGTLNNFDLTGSTSNWSTGKTFTTGPKTSSFSDYGCDTYTSPSGKHIWTKSGKYTDTLESHMGCDSIATITLTVTPTPTKTINVKACDIYQTPGGRYIAKSGTYTEKIKVTGGCDTTLTINLILGPLATHNSISVDACQSYTSPSGKYTWHSTGQYKDTLQTWIGCDSILTIDLSINHNTGSAQFSSCTPVTSPSGKHVWSQTGTYFDTMQNKAGCDSVITAQVTILQATTSQVDLFGCTQVQSPSGKYTYALEGTYVDTISNSNGCDSIMIIDVKLGKEVKSQSITACDSTLSPSGLVYYTTTGVYYDTLKTSQGCDSVIETNATINKSYTQTLEERHCQTYTSPSGKYTWTQSGDYTDSFKTVNGCDSVLEIALTIDALPVTTFTKEEDTIAHTVTLTADASSGSYQWLLCDGNSKSPINQATNQTFVADSSMSVALAVQQATCADTSACDDIEIVNSVLIPFIQIAVYPNPNNGQFRIQTEGVTVQRVEIYDLTHQLVYTSQGNSSTMLVSATLSKGVYAVMVYSERGIGFTKLVVE